MSRQPESIFADRLDAELDSIPKCWYLNVKLISIRGIPDRIGCKDGKFFAVEIKKTKKESDSVTGRISLQKWVIEKIRAAGGYAVIIHPKNFNAVVSEIRSL